MTDAFTKALQTITDPQVRKRIELERQMAGALVDACLARDLMISVYEGEDWAIIRSTDKDAIMAAMFSTDEDQLVLRRKVDAVKVGWFQLVYGNSGYDVISNSTAGPTCNEIWDVVTPLAEQLEAA